MTWSFDGSRNRAATHFFVKTSRFGGPSNKYNGKFLLPSWNATSKSRNSRLLLLPTGQLFVEDGAFGVHVVQKTRLIGITNVFFIKRSNYKAQSAQPLPRACCIRIPAFLHVCRDFICKLFWKRDNQPVPYIKNNFSEGHSRFIGQCLQLRYFGLDHPSQNIHSSWILIRNSSIECLFKCVVWACVIPFGNPHRIRDIFCRKRLNNSADRGLAGIDGQIEPLLSPAGQLFLQMGFAIGTATIILLKEQLALLFR